MNDFLSAVRDIATNEKPAAIMGDAFAAEEAVRKVAKDYPDMSFAFGSGE
jgi:basic membrane lipoprotein Med (substrate-binding protein (PBP1-ABC) superfamily)